MTTLINTNSVLCYGLHILLHKIIICYLNDKPNHIHTQVGTYYRQQPYGIHYNILFCEFI